MSFGVVRVDREITGVDTDWKLAVRRSIGDRKIRTVDSYEHTVCWNVWELCREYCFGSQMAVERE